MKGFIYTDYLRRDGRFLPRHGRLDRGRARSTSRETVRDGIEAAPQAFLDLFSGGNTGKMLVRL